jgi:hypothetical protein
MSTQSRKVNIAKLLLQLVEGQRNLMIAVATGGPAINSVSYEYGKRRFAIIDALAELGLRDPNPYADLWDWYGKWSSGDLPSYQSRRQYIRELYAPLIERLEQLAHGSEPIAAGPLREPTGWARVDRGLDKVRETLASAKSEEDFQTVGLLCRETLISLAQVTYDPNIHLPPDGTEPSETDAKRRLEAYIDKELLGSGNEETRRYAKAALSLANALQHSRTADFREAAMCAEATASVVNFIAIVSGSRDPDRRD